MAPASVEFRGLKRHGNPDTVCVAERKLLSEVLFRKGFTVSGLIFPDPRKDLGARSGEAITRLDQAHRPIWSCPTVCSTMPNTRFGCCVSPVELVERDFGEAEQLAR
jgi:hypothetical protein